MVIDNIEVTNNQLVITRKRWVIIRNGSEIFSGTARHYDFVPFDKIAGRTIKTYRSKNTALSSFKNSWHGLYNQEVVGDSITYEGDVFTAIEITETIKGKLSVTNTDEELPPDNWRAINT